MRKALAATALAAGLAVAPAISSVHAQETEATEDDDDTDRTGLIGLVGLLGLAGLAGLRRRNDPNTAYRDPTTGSPGVR